MTTTTATTARRPDRGRDQPTTKETVMMDGYDVGTGGWTMMVVLPLVVLALVIWVLARLAPPRPETTGAVT